jgi:hypothetical protein
VVSDFLDVISMPLTMPFQAMCKIVSMFRWPRHQCHVTRSAFTDGAHGIKATSYMGDKSSPLAGNNSTIIMQVVARGTV